MILMESFQIIIVSLMYMKSNTERVHFYVKSGIGARYLPTRVVSILTAKYGGRGYGGRDPFYVTTHHS